MSDEVQLTGNTEAPRDQIEHRQWLCSLVDCAAIGTLLDIGCGAGADLRTIAAQVHRSDARLVGVDASAKAVEAAGAAAADGRCTFQQHSVRGSLPFADAAFDVVYSHNFLECAPDKAALLQEVGRVLRPGGQVVFAHWDWDSQTFDGADKELVRRVVHAFADWQQPWMEHADPWMGRRLWSAFQGAGVFEGVIHTRVLTNTVYAAPWYGHARLADCAALVEQGTITAGEYARLMDDVKHQAAADQYFYSITCYAYVGRRKPAC